MNTIKYLQRSLLNLYITHSRKLAESIRPCLSGCPDNQMNTQISGIIKARDTKIGWKIPVYQARQAYLKC